MTARRAPKEAAREGTFRDLLARPKVRTWYDGRSLRSRQTADCDLKELAQVVPEPASAPST